YGWTSFFYASCVFAVICALLSLFLSESVKHPEKEVEKNHKSFSRETVIILTLFVLIHVLGNTGRGILNTTFPFYLTENFQKTKTEVGVFFSLAFGVATFISQVTSGFTADRLGRKKTMTYSVFPIPFLALLFLFASDYVSTFLVYMAIMALWSATWPASAAYLMEMSSASRRGLMMGLRLTAVRLGFTIGPLIGGFLWDNFGMTTSFYTVTAFLASSFILILLLKE
ncbi:MAG: MFS transporter, partial [Candidatus Bathyarchaeota archaeon]|nr:MFS transporter [Candidatus Bathyarchaeota archaeon]